MAIFQDILDQSRTIIQDTDKVRYTDPELLEYANEAMGEFYRIRPDLFLGSYNAAFAPSFQLTDVVPVPYSFQLAIKDYVIFRAEIRDDEFANDGRAAAFLQKFKSQLVQI